MSTLVDPKEARAILTQALAAAKSGGAGECEATLQAHRQGNLRFAANTATTAGEVERRSLSVSVAKGLRHASAASEDTSRAGIAALVDRALTQMRAAPEDPEYVALAGPQKYAAATHAYDAATATIDPKDRARAAGVVLERARAAGLVAAGFVVEDVDETTRLTSTGQEGSFRSTQAGLTTTVRRSDGSGSGYAGQQALRVGSLEVEAIAARAVDEAQRWHAPDEYAPGRYTVVMGPLAFEQLLGFGIGVLDARLTDEGRGPLSRPGGRTAEGEALFSPHVDIVADVDDPLAPVAPWGEGGLRAERHLFVEGGIVKELVRSRYWAQKTQKPATILGAAPKLAGGTKTLAELIAGTEQGLLLSHIWYVRYLNPQVAAITGLTRDATFAIENGKVTRPVKNFRFNVSMLDVLKNLDDVGAAELGEGGTAIPAVRVRDFTMSSISDAV